MSKFKHSVWGLCLLAVSLTVLSEDQSLNEDVALSKVLTKEQKQQRRIIALAPHIVESLYQIGAGEQIIGTTDHADYPAVAENILRVGNYARLQIEKIIQLKPDLVIAWRTGNPADDLERLEKYGLNVIYSDPRKLADVASELLMLGKVTGREEMAEKYANEYLDKLNKISSTYRDQAPISVFYELWARPIRTVAKNAWLQQQIELCGGANPFAKATDDYPSVGLEQVLVTLPQVVIQPDPHSSDSPDGLNWRQWRHIPAVQHDFIFHPNPDKTHRMTGRMLDEVVIMCEQIHTARQFYLGQKDQDK